MGHSQRKINAELTKMMDAYEALIKAPRTNLHKWDGYGLTTSCRMCKLFHNTDHSLSHSALCDGCPLGSEGTYQGCAGGLTRTCWSLECAIDAALAVVRDKHFKKNYPKQYATQMNLAIVDVQIVAVERMDWIIERLSENGYQYK